MSRNQEMWTTLGAVSREWYVNNVQPGDESIMQPPLDISINIRKAVALMKEQWENSKVYRISDNVMMVEKQVYFFI